MDEEMVDRVKAFVLKGAEDRERLAGVGLNNYGGTVRVAGITFVITKIDAKDCKWIADFGEAKFWETAGAMLKAAKVKTLGELLEDE